jgi:sodium/potassium/calcium exchanger 6
MSGSNESLGGHPSEENLEAADGMMGLQTQHHQQVVGSASFAASLVDEPIILHGQHGILHGDGQVPLSSVDSTPVQRTTNLAGSSDHAGAGWNIETAAEAGYTLVEDHINQACVGEGSLGIISHNWIGAWHDGKQEIKASVEELWEDIAFNGDLRFYEKFLLLCEFPFTLLRKVRVQCDIIL